MSHLCHLAADPERMRYEMNMKPLIMELILELPLLDRRVFFLKAFTDKKSRQIGHFLGLNDAHVNAIYYRVRHGICNQIRVLIANNQELINEYRHLLPA
jgi:DNA-directed RNA polymerase specialized sigma24 family protein